MRKSQGQMGNGGPSHCPWRYQDTRPPMASIGITSEIVNKRHVDGIRTLEGAGAVQSRLDKTISKGQMASTLQLDHERPQLG